MQVFPQKILFGKWCQVLGNSISICSDTEIDKGVRCIYHVSKVDSKSWVGSVLEFSHLTHLQWCTRCCQPWTWRLFWKASWSAELLRREKGDLRGRRGCCWRKGCWKLVGCGFLSLIRSRLVLGALWSPTRSVPLLAAAAKRQRRGSWR